MFTTITASFMTYSAYVEGTVPALKPAGKRGAIVLWHFVLFIYIS